MLLVEPDCMKLAGLHTETSQEERVPTSHINYWLTIKSCFMKHFPKQGKDYPHTKNSFDELMLLQNKIIPKLRDELENYQCTFENIFCMARSLHDMNTYTQLQSNIRNIKETKKMLKDSLNHYHAIVNDDPLVITYSKYLSCLYRAMTTLCKISPNIDSNSVDDSVYTWNRFLKIIDSVIAKKKRENRKKDHHDESENDDENSEARQDYKQKLKEIDNEIDCDFDLLYSAIIPSVYSVI